MNFEKLDSKPNLPKIQEEVLAFWEKDNTFKKSVSKDKKEVVFYDGPPFPTGKPHHGTVLVSFIKDMVARYWTMRGYKVNRQWGWDCHGLPIETQVETNLGLTSKKDIECKLGIGKFNDACHNLVSVNNDTWKTYVNEMARWVDYDGSYKTMDTNFMESVIWAFKEIYNKNLIYKDYRVTPYCFRCQTSLSISDTRESDSTRPKQDTWVLVKFKSEQKLNNKPVYFLAWTTTPWTLPSNMALAVGKNLNYAFVEQENAVLVTGESSVGRYEKVFGKTPNIVKTCKGEELLGLKYEPIFNYFKDKKEEGAFVVIAADYVDDSDGVAIVHTAPAFGEDDYWSCKKNNVPLVNPVDAEGRFTSEVSDYAGENVLDINKEIIRQLKNENIVLDSGSIEHNYPHCWRCRTPLIYKAMDAWYFNIDVIKSRLLELNEEINWVPEVVKHGRFGNWLENARDWNISRNRYWSTPLPVWECECGHREVLGSIDEIYEKSGKRVSDLHRQHLDEITYECSKCGKTMSRIPEVIDCWFESAAVPFARMHYPFENKEWFENNITSDFVVEYTGQIRCWFYYLLILSGAMFDKIPFKNAIVHGTVLAKDGKKLSKSSKNYTDPMELMKSYGTDAFRLYMYNSSAMLLGDLQFNEEGILDALKEVILPFWNACAFFTTYASIDNYEPSVNTIPNSDDPLDKWILAKLYEAQTKITENMDKYQVDQYVVYIKPLIDGLTNWYIRRSRRRFWGKGLEKDKINAYDTLYYVLVNTIKLMAPITPIISEKLYQSLTNEPSVHLSDWPTILEQFKDEKLIKENELTQNIIYLGRAIRNKNSIKVRQPLNKLLVAVSDEEKLESIQKFSDVICEELNVKTLELVNDVKNIAEVKYKPNFSTLAPENKSKIPQIVKALNQNKIEFRGDSALINLDNEVLTLKKEDILVEYYGKDGQNIMHEKGIVAALDLKISDELLKEGVARDIVRQIQDVRKQLGFEITDQIKISLSGNYPKDWTDYITRETLSTIEEFENEKYSCNLESNDGNIIIKIK
jgi:isoleucyl-tRNA synthetase